MLNQNMMNFYAVIRNKNKEAMSFIALASFGFSNVDIQGSNPYPQLLIYQKTLIGNKN